MTRSTYELFSEDEIQALEKRLKPPTNEALLQNQELFEGESFVRMCARFLADPGIENQAHLVSHAIAADCLENRTEIPHRVSQTEACKASWLACLIIAKELTSLNESLPPELQRFVVSVALGERRSPSRNGRPGKTQQRRMIIAAVHHILRKNATMQLEKNGAWSWEEKLGAYSNDVSKTPTACEIVHRILKDEGIVISLNRIHTIWQERDRDC
ncbi:MAG: hypothetical protein P1U64_04050 [Alcanivoracaceae bacterium]|nr:hypothetical protein [Alcanivoracaceae bacterium]